MDALQSDDRWTPILGSASPMQLGSLVSMSLWQHAFWNPFQLQSCRGSGDDQLAPIPTAIFMPEVAQHRKMQHSKMFDND